MEDAVTVILLILIISMYGYAVGYTLGAIIKALINEDKRKDDK